MDTDGTNQAMLTSSSGVNINPVFDPEGDRIAFETSRDGATQIYLMEPDGSNEINLTNDVTFNTSHPTYHPRNGRIYFHSTVDSFSQIFSMNGTGGDITQLTFDSHNASPTFAPRFKNSIVIGPAIGGGGGIGPITP